MNKTVKLLVTGILLPVVIILLAVVTVQSVMEPIKFNKAKDARESGQQVLVVRMNKNKKFQKEQLSKEGYEEFEEFFNK